MTISEVEALAAARSAVERAGFEWTEPVRIRQRRKYYQVVTNADMRGGNIWLKVDAESGKVELSGPSPR